MSSLNFLQPLLLQPQVAFITVMIFHVISFSWLDSSVGRMLYHYHRGHGFESHLSLDFVLRLYFCNSLSCVQNCDDFWGPTSFSHNSGNDISHIHFNTR